MRTCGKIHVSKLSSRGAPLHLPHSCWSGHRTKHVFLLLLRTAWLMSLRMHCHMGPGVRNGLLGAKDHRPSWQAVLSSQQTPVPLHPVTHRISMDNKVGESENTYTMNEQFRDTDATIAQAGVTSGEFLSKAHIWGDCDRRHMFVYTHKGEPNGPPGQWCQVIRTHQQGSTSESSVSLPMKAIPGDEKAAHPTWCPDLRDY